MIPSTSSQALEQLSNDQCFVFTLATDSDNLVESDATTLSMSSGALTSSSETSPAPKRLFDQFKIPWEKIPSNIMDQLQKKQKLGKLLNVFANLLVDEMRMFSLYLPMSILRMITQQAVSRFPDSFTERDSEGNIISTSTVPLLTIMRNRNNFLNRSPNCTKTNLDPDIPQKQRRRSSLLQQTCNNWQPKNLVSMDSVESLENKKDYLKLIHGATTTCDEKTLIKQYMQDCFPIQRKFFNNLENIPTILQIKTEWPFIFESEYLYQHFEQLMNIKSEIFIENFQSSNDKIFRYFNEVNKKIRIENSSAINIISGIANYFGEDTTYLFMNFDVSYI